MIKTKSILDKTEYQENETRICVMRYVKPFYVYDEWIPAIAPSVQLLKSYQDQKLSWDKFTTRYQDEMRSRIVQIARLRRRSNQGEDIILLCWEWSPERCHRSILKKLIDNCCIFVSNK